VLEELGLEMVDPPGPVHEYVGEDALVLAVSVVVDDPQVSVPAVMLAVGAAVAVMEEMIMYCDHGSAE
jgi:hypothetical protein